ncbi:molybdopterin synthase catalytic subunit MoaE [Nitrogeniibacter mangrovi]|uniref:Molybdopterin synthase catalytic subunit n=1 Tax=Nitrogeniibacter mangrovi TaxID=2016596 RepID=A0A6C1B5T2_9RHOO|nr:molybdopterin synthase catalytic subunit MoaE [Nitrogeniibacter mangrovi]QID17660.1 molybdopterin synthase catalytic subunit MoaE [Nitrogeniibacter mangrovi]
MRTIKVQEADFDGGALTRALGAGRTDVGAVATFTGLVRGASDGVEEMTLEHYPGMTEQSLGEIVEQAERRWQVLGVTVIHRVGALKPGDQIVYVGVASAHRGDAFAACEFIMDYLKTRAPFWKKETTVDGTRWVDARDTDDAAAARWEDVEMRR